MTLPPAPSFAQQVTFLNCADLEVSSRFYAELLGLELVLDQGSCRIYRVAPNAFLGLCGGRSPGPSGVIVTLVTDAVEAWGARLRAAGVELEKGPVYNPDYDIVQLFVRDPDGTLVEIQRFCDPAWPAPA
jgi:catechol 2,3-dioxygenase-like lactoylglutathione lyase family enzyme